MDMNILNMIFDSTLLLTIAGLWGLWFQQMKQRKKVEEMLQAASSDLKQATALLHLAMQDKAKGKAKSKDVDVAPIEKAVSQQDKVNIQANVKKLEAPAKKEKVSVSYATQIMRLNREGHTMEAIAKHLDLPIAQVKLMLLLQTSKV